MILLALKLSFLEIVGFLSAFLVGISLGLLGKWWISFSNASFNIYF